MNQAKYRQFENFNFEKNVVWNEYVSQIDKGVPKERIEKLKKIWYKDNIDPDFDPEWKVQPGQQQHQQQQQQQQYQQQQQQQRQAGTYTELPLIKKSLYDAENILKFVFILGAMLHLSFTSIVAFAVCILALYRQLKMPKWNKEYGRLLFVNEFTHNIVYIFGFFFVSNYQILYNTPLILHFWIGLAEYLNQRKGFLYEKTQKYVDASRARKDDLMNMKLRIEIFIFPITIVLALMQSASLFMILFYGNFLRIKYIVNPKTQGQCQYINYKYLTPYANRPGIGFIITKFQAFCGYMVKVK